MADRKVLFRSNGNLNEVSDTADDITVGGVKITSAGSLLFSTDVQLSRGGADQLDLASGDSLNLAGGSLLIGGSTIIDSGGHATFTSDSTDPGVNVGTVAGDPSSLANGDIWYNSSTGKFRGREGGSSVDLIASSTSPWQTTANVVNLVTAGDTVTVGTGATAGGKLMVDGDADEIQLQIQGNGTQTSNLIVAEQSDGTDVFTLDNSGNGVFAGSVQTGDLNMKAKDGSAHWTLREMPDHLLAINNITGKQYKFLMEEV